MGDWLTLLSTARRMANLTQEDFAADLGVSRSMLTHWENGRRPIPTKIKRRVLDFMGGYYRRRPEYGCLLANAETDGQFVTLYRQGAIIQDATTYAKRTWRKSMNFEMCGQSILPLMRQNMRFLEFYEHFYSKMLVNKSEIISISYVDESLLFPDRLVKATAVAVAMGEGRILRLENKFLPIEESRSILNKEPEIISADDAS